jgi:hypothetical protein
MKGGLGMLDALSLLADALAGAVFKYFGIDLTSFLQNILTFLGGGQ